MPKKLIIHPAICQAIAELRRLSLVYNGKTRILEPHSHGLSTAGNEVIRARQAADPTSSGDATAKLWLLEKCSQITLLDEVFDPGSDYETNDLSLMSIHCEL